MTLIERLERTEAPSRELFAEAAKEILALRVMMGAGCDANNDGPHTIMRQGKSEFCTQCGEDTKNGRTKVWFTEERLERTLDHLCIAALRAQEVDSNLQKTQIGQEADRD